MGTIVCIDVSRYHLSGHIIDGILSLVEEMLRQRTLPAPKMIIRQQVNGIDHAKIGLNRPVVSLIMFGRGDEQKVEEAISELRHLAGPDVPAFGFCFNSYWDETELIGLMAVCLRGGQSLASLAIAIVEALHPTKQ